MTYLACFAQPHVTHAPILLLPHQHVPLLLQPEKPATVKWIRNHVLSIQRLPACIFLRCAPQRVQRVQHKVQRMPPRRCPVPHLHLRQHTYRQIYRHRYRVIVQQRPLQTLQRTFPHPTQLMYHPVHLQCSQLVLATGYQMYQDVT